MKKWIKKFRNRYLLSAFIAVIYMALLHSTDAYMLYQRNKKVENLENEIERKKQEIEKMKKNIAELEDLRSLEKYAREHYYFKKDNEDLFIFSFE